MTLRTRRRVYRHVLAILAAGLLSACGGGAEIVAIVSIVTPLGGSWAVDANETMTFTAPLETEVFASKFDVQVTLTTATNVCDGGFVPGGSVDLEGTIDNGNLALRTVGAPKTTSCLQGKFTDLRTIEVVPAGKSKLIYLNTRVAVNLSVGLWVSDGMALLKLKFKEPDSVDNDATASVAGCDVSGGSVIKFLGVMNGFKTTNGSKPLIPELTLDPPNGSPPLFTQVVFVDGATLKLVDSNGKAVTLHRKADITTTCPP